MLLKEKKEHPERKIVVPTAISLSNDDLPRLINGRPEDPIEERTFDITFTIERIQKSWENVGFVTFTRKCLMNNKVRSERGRQSQTRN